MREITMVKPTDSLLRTLHLPEPYPLQRAIMASPAKRKVICAGRRAGKTEMAALMAIRNDENRLGLAYGSQVLITSTTQDQADVSWRRIKAWLRPLLDSHDAYKSDSHRLIEWKGGRLRVKTGWDADVLRGEDADLLILDECARLDPVAWYEVGAPMLADLDGTAVFISTPNRRNWFYTLYNHALENDSGRWAAWRFPTHANPFLSTVGVAELASDMTSDAYRQEILAEFLEDQGQVFHNITGCATAQVTLPYLGQFVMGVDWGQANDYTCVGVMDRQTRRLVDMDRFNGLPWAAQRGRLRAMAERWQPQLILAESNSIGGPNIEALVADGLPVQGFEMTASSKPQVIESLALAFERNEICILDDPVLVGELGAYERHASRLTGRSQYGAPQGLHDDTVIMLALC